jgi:glycosyltransferase involved in cell wall biosynthesis
VDQVYITQQTPHHIAFIGNFLPRQCGIATFTTDLLHAVADAAPGSVCYAVAMNDVHEGYAYAPQVRFEVNDKRLAEYYLAADFLNANHVEVVSLQHEFGIFGGTSGRYILELLRHLRMPVVTTLHTVVSRPEPEQKAVIHELGHLSERLVVMSHKAQAILQAEYELPAEKVVMIPHGIPDLPFIDPSFYKDQFAVEGRRVILTFGLLSPDKGLEYMIEALPTVLQHYPDTVYMIVGVTHPHIKRDHGERYRQSLQQLAHTHGVEKHLIFHNRFVDLQELGELLSVADLYVTPYLKKEQITSGTLAYALGTGKATLSTPYWYAEEMLADGRGRLVPFRDAKALAAQVIDLFDHEVERHALRKRAYTYCRNMIWKEVACRYVEVLTEVAQAQRQCAKPALVTQPWGRSAPMPLIKLDHLRRLTDDVGILQHANYVVPNRLHGYCTDDNARALIAVMLAQRVLPESGELLELGYRYLSFVAHAFDERTTRFRNFMGYDRRWLEDVGSEDSHGRALWSLGVTVALAPVGELSEVALDLFEQALPVVKQFSHPRAWAYTQMGLHAYLQRFRGDRNVKHIQQQLAQQLFDLYQHHATEDWPWIADTLTYANARVAHALLLSGDDLRHEEMIASGLRMLAWLIRIQTGDQGYFTPIGNQGWYPRHGVKARFDQQPIEVQSTIEACLTAYKMTREKQWSLVANRCLEWFLGRNDAHTPLYDEVTGGCRDGVTGRGMNRNQGAESTLSWLLSLLHMSIHKNHDYTSITRQPSIKELSGSHSHALGG